MYLPLNSIVWGHNVDILKTFPNECIDLTITSPPYNNLRKYKEYTFDFEHLAYQLYRVTKIGGVVVWIVADATIKGSETGTSFRQALYFKEIGFNLHDTMIYEKDSCAFPETNRYYPYFEYMFILSKGKPKTANLIRDKINTQANDLVTGTQREVDGTLSIKSAIRNNTGRRINAYGIRGNVWKYQTGKWKVTKDAIAYTHPAIFPEQLAEDHILSWSNEQDIVLDPMCGSGTTLKMAIKNNRKYIGIDIAQEYVDLSRKRIESI